MNNNYLSLMDTVGNTPLVRIQRLANADTNSVVLGKLEGNNPAGSVKDRPAVNMILQAQNRGDIQPGDTLIEATSGNTGIAVAMAASMMGYRMKLIMPDNMSMERKAAMAAYGAELLLVSKESGMEGARDLAQSMADKGEGTVLDQFANPDNPLAHYKTTGPEIWQATSGSITHFVSAMGTTGTIMGTSMYLKEQNPHIEIVGVQPQDGASIPGIRRWPQAYLPKIYDPKRVDRVIEVSQQQAESTMRAMAAQEGIFAGVSSGGAMAVALQLASEIENATIVTIVCDRGDRYLSTNVYPTDKIHLV
ncbi:MAG: cysteine synthase B [Thiomicrospira sp. CG2_30_44_34]|nr:MAG: cysteine synthase B [Thiomicrospira sp. CG2_30_44_34]